MFIRLIFFTDSDFSVFIVMSLTDFVCDFTSVFFGDGEIRWSKDMGRNGADRIKSRLATVQHFGVSRLNQTQYIVGISDLFELISSTRGPYAFGIEQGTLRQRCHTFLWQYGI